MKPSIDELIKRQTVDGKIYCKYHYGFGNVKHDSDFVVVTWKPFQPFLVCSKHVKDYEKVNAKVLTFNQYLAEPEEALKQCTEKAV